jgi:hypothetical protein
MWEWTSMISVILRAEEVGWLSLFSNLDIALDPFVIFEVIGLVRCIHDSKT